MIAPPAQQVDSPTAPRPLQTDTARRVEELGRIILAYSEVTERLQKSQDQLHQKVVSLSNELGEKNRQLERRNRLAALGEMAAGLAHEIRNPLGGIQLYASILRKDLTGKDESLAIIRKISDGVKRVEALVGQVLQFSREMVVNLRETDLAEIINQSVELAQFRFSDRGVSCDVTGPQSLAVKADPLMLGQAIVNLLTNAAEACDAGATVRLEYGPPTDQAEARQYRIVVRDQGPGIPSEILDRIFNPFFTTKDEGTGLGLSIVHRIIEAHEGTITAANDPAGGARFEIRV